MKTMKKGDKITRIKDKDCKTYLDMGYEYTSKSEWKKLRKEVKLEKEVKSEKKTKRGKGSK
jgi:hypothetical protein